MKKIYVACSLTHSPEEYVKSILDFKDSLRANYQILDFLCLEKDEPQDVFERDTQHVKDCDLLVADCSYPSIGLGYELAVAMQKEKSILAIAKKDLKVSRLLQGMTIYPKFQLVYYDNIADIIPKLSEF